LNKIMAEIGRWKKSLLLIFFFGSWLFWTGCSSDRKAEGRARGDDYSAKIEANLTGIHLYEGGAEEVRLRLKNSGKMEWSSQGQNPSLVCYHILDDEGGVLKFDNVRTALPNPVRPGEEITLPVRVKAPLKAGNYRLEFDLVREGIAWFKDTGSPTLVMPLQVGEMPWTGVTRVESSIPEFMDLQKLIRITLDNDAVEFEGRTGKVQGFTAGAGYPQIWLRDAATIIPASRLFYPDTFLVSWLEEHLAFQKADGGLEDWVDFQGKSDKNTVETDQEASAVQSAYQVFLLKGKEWLEKKVGGERVIGRLEKAVEFLFRNRFDRERGLITGAHTADWGDIDSEDVDQKAVYADERTRWTSDIYDQSMCYESCRELAAMFRSLGIREKSDSWLRQAASLRDAADRHLWQEDRGFYRVHIHLDSFPHDFDEGAMFAMGGNVQAIISGLAGPTKASRIIQAALDVQKKFRISSISGSLLPPYPAGFFRHPAMDEPYEYQNGGQWDWFGGRLIMAMFDNGFSAQAREKLIEIAQKDVRNGGLFEWDTKDGAGRGSDDYAGSAGSLARALYEGYFGFKLEERSLVLEPKLGADDARTRLDLPSSGLVLSYENRTQRPENKIVFSYESNYSGPAEVHLLVPWAFFGAADRDTGKKDLEVRKDGVSCPFRWLSRNQDDFIVLDTDLGKHSLEVALKNRQ
jgi:Mannosylglycerate hydrolase MGH1-like glycoside hydrolase domain